MILYDKLTRWLEEGDGHLCVVICVFAESVINDIFDSFGEEAEFCR